MINLGFHKEHTKIKRVILVKYSKVIKGRPFAYEVAPRGKMLHMDVCDNCKGELPNYPKSNFCLHCGSKLIFDENREWK